MSGRGVQQDGEERGRATNGGGSYRLRSVNSRIMAEGKISAGFGQVGNESKTIPLLSNSHGQVGNYKLR